MNLHFVFEDIHITELAHFGQLSGDPSPVSLVVLVGEYRHPALSTVIFIFSLALRVPLRCLVAGEVSQPGGSGGELKEGDGQHNKPEPAYSYLG